MRFWLLHFAVYFFYILSWTLENCLNNSNKNSFLHSFDFFWSIIKLKDNVLFFVTFLPFLSNFWYIVVKNVIFEIKMQKAMIHFVREFYYYNVNFVTTLLLWYWRLHQNLYSSDTFFWPLYWILSFV